MQLDADLAGENWAPSSQPADFKPTPYPGHMSTRIIRSDQPVISTGSASSTLNETSAALSRGWGAFSSALAGVSKSISQSVSDADKWSKEPSGEKRSTSYKGTTETLNGRNKVNSVASNSSSVPSQSLSSEPHRPMDARAAAAEAAELRMQAVSLFQHVIDASVKIKTPQNKAKNKGPLIAKLEAAKKSSKVPSSGKESNLLVVSLANNLE